MKFFLTKFTNPGGGNKSEETQTVKTGLSFFRTLSVAEVCRAYFAYSGTDKGITGGAL